MHLSDDAFFKPMESALESLPHLRTVLPSGYPRSTVKKAEALQFEEVRSARYPHNHNLPLALYLVGEDKAPPHARQFCTQIVAELDEFVARFSSLPRVKRVLAPLWQSPFTEEPKLWSVIAHCRIASRLHDIGRPVYGFEVPPGSGNKTADIHCEINSHEAFVDIEMWHELWGETAETIRGAAKKRCETKAQKKFLDLKENAIGVVVQVAFADDMSAILNSQDVLTSFELEAPSRCAGQLMLIAANGKDGRGTSYRVLFDGENW